MLLQPEHIPTVQGPPDDKIEPHPEQPSPGALSDRRPVEPTHHHPLPQDKIPSPGHPARVVPQLPHHRSPQRILLRPFPVGQGGTHPRGSAASAGLLAGRLYAIL